MHTPTEAGPTAVAVAEWRTRLPLLDVGVMLAGVIAFCALMYILAWVLFPAGLSLGALVTGENAAFVTARNAPRSLAYAGDGEANSVVATLTRFRRNVKLKPAGSVAWFEARNGLTLRGQDAVQTFARSRATLRLGDANFLTLGEKSLMVFQDAAPDPFVQRHRSTMVMMHGELSGQMGETGGEPVELALALPNALVRLLSRTGDGSDVAFQLNVNPDNSSTLSVFGGSAQIMTDDAMHTVGENEGVTLDEAGRIVARGGLPGRPSITRPAEAALEVYRDLPPRIDFQWSAVPGSRHYRFRLALDAELSEAIVDERVAGTSYSLASLREGRYFWQVSALDGWHEGPPAGRRSLRVARSDAPPKLELEPMPETVHGDAVVLRGRTAPDVMVYVQGKALPRSGDGEFMTRIQLKPGASLVVIEAVDPLGNVAYASHIFNAKQPLPGGAE